MKKIILLIIVCCATAIATAQQTERFTFATSVGAGNHSVCVASSWLLCYQQTAIGRYRDRIIYL